MQKLYIEVADTPLKRQYGLMDRRDLGKNAGMLFQFPNKARRSFWMQNTYIPLDIAFIDGRGKIFQIANMIPTSTKPVSSSRSCRYVLEVNRGWFKNNGLKVGSSVGIDGMVLGDNSIRTAQEQMEMDLDMEQGEEIPLNVEEEPAEPAEPTANATESQLSQTVRQRFQRVNAHNGLLINRDRQLDILVFYQTEEHGKTLLPRVCRGLGAMPKFTFEPGAGNGELVRLMDVSPMITGTQPSGEAWECGPGEKTFIINDILHMTEVLRSDPTHDASAEIVAWYREMDNIPAEMQEFMNFM